MLYRVYSESNASDEIKWKLSLVQKNVFYQIFPHGYCRSERTFQIASTTAGSQGRTCLWWWDAWPPPRSSSSFPNSPCGQKAVDFFWETGNRLSGTDQAKKGIFEGLGLVADQPSVHYDGGVDSRFTASLPTFSPGPGPHAGWTKLY